MSGGGSSAPAVPSTTTQVQDIPAWEQGYVTNLLGQAQTVAAQPYQQFQGPQVAGFTQDQQNAFSSIENMPSQYQPTTQAGVNAATQGANTVNNIYGNGAGDINAATTYNPLQAISPYLGAASQYNSAAASQPWLNQAAGYQGAAAMAATPQGIQSYMSPYTNDVVNGIQNEANLNWNQNIMPGVNDKFVGSGQYGSGRNAQVLGQAAGNFQTGLSSNVANALESGYTTAGNQAANEAGILSGLGSQSLTGAGVAGNAQTSQINNLLGQASAAGQATTQQATNLQNAGMNLGNLTSTQGQQQLNAGTTLGALGNLQQTQGDTQAQNLQAVGQQQQQLNQSNINTAMQNFQNQVNWPAQQTEYLNQIIRGLPAPTASTSASQTPAYSVSPLAGLGGATAGALSTLVGKKKGGLIKTYSEGGVVEDDTDPSASPLDAITFNDNSDASDTSNVGTALSSPLDSLQTQTDLLEVPDSLQMTDTSDTAPANPLDTKSPDDSSMPTPPETATFSKSDMQRNQLLALARGLLTPTAPGVGFAGAFGQGLGNVQDVAMEDQKWNAQQQNKLYDRDIDKQKLDLERQKIEMGKYAPVKDAFGNVTGVLDTKTGKIVTNSGVGAPGGMSEQPVDNKPSADPQKAAQQILDEEGTPFTPVASRQDITGRNAQAKAYRDAAQAAKKAQQDLDSLAAQTGKYTPGGGMGKLYGAESYLGLGGDEATARTEADKASKNLANSFMQANVGAKGSGIKMVEFDAGAVPNADMTDEARAALIAKNKAIANSQIQRAAISDMYPRMQLSNVNTIMDNYETKNPPILPSGDANPSWMTYKDWLKAGRPNTAAVTVKGTATPPSASSPNPANNSQAILAAIAAERKRRQGASQ